MLTNKSPHCLQEGKKWLAELHKSECSSFRTFTDYICDALNRGYYTEEELGISEEQVLELAVNHAANAAKNGNPAEMALKYHFQGRLGKVQARRKVVVLAEKRQERLAA